MVRGIDWLRDSIKRRILVTECFASCAVRFHVAHDETRTCFLTQVSNSALDRD